MQRYRYDSKYDLNCDGVVDEQDFEVFKSYYGKQVDLNDPVSVACDFNGDGWIVGGDFSMFLTYMQKNAIPEVVAEKEKPRLGQWLPMGPWYGPPLPRFLEVYWPWHKKGGMG